MSEKPKKPSPSKIAKAATQKAEDMGLEGVRFEATYSIGGDLEYTRYDDGSETKSFTPEQLEASVMESMSQGTDIGINAGGGGGGGGSIDNIHVIYQDNTVANFSVATVIAANGDLALTNRNFGIKFTVTSGTATMTKGTAYASVADTSVYDDVYFYLPVLRASYGLVCAGGTYKETIIAINGAARSTLIKIG